MKLIIVDQNDSVIGIKDKKDRTEADIIRVAGLWVYNSHKQVLIAQRVFSKKHDPGKWGPSAAGTVEEGETYLSNITKEAFEELGVNLKEEDVTEVSHRFMATSHRFFCMAYFAKVDLPESEFVIQKEEVEQVKWISIEELEKWFEEKPEDFIKSFEDSLGDAVRFVQTLKD